MKQPDVHTALHGRNQMMDINKAILQYNEKWSDTIPSIQKVDNIRALIALDSPETALLLPKPANTS